MRNARSMVRPKSCNKEQAYSNHKKARLLWTVFYFNKRVNCELQRTTGFDIPCPTNACKDRCFKNDMNYTAREWIPLSETLTRRILKRGSYRLGKTS